MKPLIVVLLSAFSYVLAKSITKPLHNTLGVVNDLVSGKADMLDGLKVTGKDEMARLAQAVNQLIEKLRGLVNELMKSSETLIVISAVSREAVRQASKVNVADVANDRSASRMTPSPSIVPLLPILSAAGDPVICTLPTPAPSASPSSCQGPVQV